MNNIKHLVEEDNEGKIRYICNWGVNPKDPKIVTELREVTCKNCLKIFGSRK